MIIKKITFIVLLGIVFGVSTYSKPKKGAMAGLNDRYVFGIWPGVSAHMQEFVPNAEIGLMYQRFECKNIRIQRFTFNYAFTDSFTEYGLKYHRNIGRPVLFPIAPYPFFALKAATYDAPGGVGYIVKPELGLALIISRKHTPYISMYFSYGYNWDILNEGYYPLEKHSVNASLGLGIVW